MSNKIVIIGSNEHQNPLILKAKEMGYETHVFAWQMGDVGEKTADYYYPISITNKHAILEKCKDIKPQGIISMASDLAAITVAYLTEKMGCIGNSRDTVEICTNKLAFRKRMLDKGIKQPKFVEVGDIFPEEKMKTLQLPVVVKPSDRSGNRGVIKADNRKDMIRALSTAKEFSFERKAIVEEYIPGEYYSCECYTENGKHTLVALTKRSSIEFRNAFLDYERIQGSELVIDAEVEKAVLEVLDAVNMQNGASSVEFIRNEEGIWIIEVMPSMYGDYIATDLVPLVYGFNYVEKAISIACGKAMPISTDLSKGNAQKAAVRFVLSKADYSAFIHKNNESKIVHASRFDEASNIPDDITGINYGYFVEKAE